MRPWASAEKNAEPSAVPAEQLGGGVPGVPPVGLWVRRSCACSAAAEGPLTLPPRDSWLAQPLLAALRFLAHFMRIFESYIVSFMIFILIRVFRTAASLQACEKICIFTILEKSFL